MATNFFYVIVKLIIKVNIRRSNLHCCTSRDSPPVESWNSLDGMYWRRLHLHHRYFPFLSLLVFYQTLSLSKSQSQPSAVWSHRGTLLSVHHQPSCGGSNRIYIRWPFEKAEKNPRRELKTQALMAWYLPNWRYWSSAFVSFPLLSSIIYYHRTPTLVALTN